MYYIITDCFFVNLIRSIGIYDGFKNESTYNEPLRKTTYEMHIDADSYKDWA